MRERAGKERLFSPFSLFSPPPSLSPPSFFSSLPSFSLVTLFFFLLLLSGQGYGRASFLNFRLAYPDGRSNVNHEYQAEPEYTLTCYEHVLQDAQSVERHRLHTPGAPEWAYSFRFPVSHLEYAEVALLEVRELHLDEMSGVADEARTCTDSLRETGDGLRLAWSEFVGWPHFSEFAMPCPPQREQTLGVSISSHYDWGGEPRLAGRDGKTGQSRVYRPRHGQESMDAVVQRLNREHREQPEALQTVVLTAYLRSQTPLAVRGLRVRKCLVEPPNPAAIPALQSPGGAASSGVDPVLAAELRSVPVALTIDELAPRLLPLRSCVWEESASGTCFVELGWVSAHTDVVDADGCHEGNCLQPSELAMRTDMPVQFEPGWHRNRTRLAWFCHGRRPGDWTTLRWTLGNGIVQVDHTTPLCYDTHMMWGDSDAADLPPIAKYMVQDGSLARHMLPAGVHLGPAMIGHQQHHVQLGIDQLISAKCVLNQYDCTADDDVDQVLTAIGVVLLIDVAIVIVYFIVGFFIGMTPNLQTIIYIVVLVDLAVVAFIGYNFIFAPRLNRPNGVEAPGNIFGLSGQENPLGGLQPSGSVPNPPGGSTVQPPNSGQSGTYSTVGTGP